MSSPVTDSAFLNTFIASFVRRGLDTAGPMMTLQFAAFIATLTGAAINAMPLLPPTSSLVSGIKGLPNMTRTAFVDTGNNISIAMKKTVDLRIGSDVDFFMNIISTINVPMLVNLKRALNSMILEIEPSTLKDLRSRVEMLTPGMSNILGNIYDIAVAAVTEANTPRVGAPVASVAPRVGAPVASVAPVGASGPVFAARIGGYRKTKGKRYQKGKTRGRR